MESFAHMGSIHVISSATSVMANVEYSSGVVGALLYGIRFGKSNFICVVVFFYCYVNLSFFLAYVIL